MVGMEKRPTTATLIKPSVLDTRLLGIFDMTTVSREHLLAIKNLVHSTPRCKCKPPISVMETFTIDCNSAKLSNNDDNGDGSSMKKACKELNKTYRVRRHLAKSNLPDSEEHASSEERKPKVPCIPIPCVTCGREDQPERFHSHPSRRQVKTKEAAATTRATDVRKTVQKPVPIKFRSAKAKSNDTKDTTKSDSRRGRPPHAKPHEQKPSKSPDVPNDASKLSPKKEKTKVQTNWKEATRKMTLQPSKHDDSSKVGTKNFLSTPRYEAYKLDTWIPAPVSGERKRKTVCHLCAQEFGTALLPSHEAQCIQKYLIETNDGKDDSGIKSEILSSQAKENWKLAWELTQTVLIACKCCGRKFLPNRVEAHQKICSLKSNNYHRLKTTRPPKFGVKCCEPNDKWSNSRLVPQVAGPESIEPKAASASSSPPQKSNIDSLRPAVGVEINSSGDEKEHNVAECDTVEVFWKAHQAQLVPCTKCGRTFYPHRLEVHMRGCKETRPHKRKPVKVNREITKPKFKKKKRKNKEEPYYYDDEYDFTIEK